MRIDKLLSQLKYGSRREMKDFFKMHEVIVNGNKVHQGRLEVNPNIDIILIDQEQVFYEFPICIKIYKPKGYLSANHDMKYPCVTELIKPPYHRFDLSIAGRLDLDSEGLLILTNDGHLLHQITHPNTHMNKIYQVHLDKPFKDHEKLLKGVIIKDGRNQDYLAKAIHIESSIDCVKITIDEGKFHQVKRMFKAVGYDVINLKRIAIGALTLGDLKPGTYQSFKKEELYD